MNLDPRHTFECLNSGDRYVLEASATSWTDVAEKFGQYLRGCGYYVSDRQLADYLSEFAGPESTGETP